MWSEHEKNVPFESWKTRWAIYRLATFDHFLCLCAFSESVLESACHGLHVAHAARTRSAATLGFFTPVELSHFTRGVST